MNNKGLRITALILGIVALIMVIIINTDNGIIRQVKAKQELEAYELTLDHLDNTVFLKKYLEQYPDAPAEHIAKIQYIYEERCFEQIEKDPTQEKWEEYIVQFPDGHLTVQAKKKLKAYAEERDYDAAVKANTEEQYEAFIREYPNGIYFSEVSERLAELRKQKEYLDNSLSNGSQPYAKYYGRNKSKYYGCSTIKVNASKNTDVVVIVHYDSHDGPVAGHTYVKKGNTAEVYLPANRSYQVGFYSGNGWYPDKEVKDKKGGFLRDENVQMDDVIYLKSNTEIEYTLALVLHGNLHLEDCSLEDIL